MNTTPTILHGYCKHAGRRLLHVHPLSEPMDVSNIWPGGVAVAFECCEECWDGPKSQTKD